MAELQILTHLVEGVPEIRLLGELDSYSAPRVRHLLSERIAGGMPSILLRLTDLDYIDSTGLGVLVAALKQATDQSGTLVLIEPSPMVARVLEITGLDKVFTVVSFSPGPSAAPVPH